MICSKYFFIYAFLLALVLSSCNNENPDPAFLRQSEYFKIAESEDVKLDNPLPFEWRYMHDEKRQTFDDYKKTSFPQNKSNIYILPVGEFTPLQTKILQATREYIEIFYQQHTILLPSLSDGQVPKTALRMQSDNHMQLLASYVLDSLLKDKLPNDGIALMALSSKDLYPKEEWNYVFGLSSYVNRVGVTSIYRFQNTALADSLNYKLTLGRLINVSSHELGHMMQMKHCLQAKCVMNGSNSLAETDKAPNRLCSECQKKMFWRFRYDNARRLKQLIGFFEKAGLQKDYQLLKPELEAIE